MCYFLFRLILFWWISDGGGGEGFWQESSKMPQIDRHDKEMEDIDWIGVS